MAVFIDTKGNRHTGVELPASLLKPGVSRRQQESYLIKSGQINTEPLPVITEPEVVQQQVIADSVVSALEGRLAALEQRPPSPVPDSASLERLAISVQRAAISKDEIVQVADDATGRIETVATGFEDRLKTAESREQALLEAVSEGVSKGEENISLAVNAFQQKGASAIVEIEKESLSVAKREARSEANRTAPAEAKKHWFSSVTNCPESPEDVDHSSWARRWYGRDQLIEGDGAFVTSSKHGVTPVRYAGGQWRRLAEFVPKTELVSQQLSVHDESSPVTVVLGASTKGGGGSGGAQRLAVRTLTSGLAGTLVDSSAWSAAGAEIHAAEILLRVSTGVGSAFLAATLNMNADGRNWEYTEFSLLGDLTNVAGFAVDLRPYLGTPIIPPGVPAPPASTMKQAFFVEATIRGAAGAYFVEGAVTYLVRAEGRTSTVTGAEPLWQVI